MCYSILIFILGAYNLSVLKYMSHSSNAMQSLVCQYQASARKFTFSATDYCRLIDLSIRFRLKELSESIRNLGCYLEKIDMQITWNLVCSGMQIYCEFT